MRTLFEALIPADWDNVTCALDALDAAIELYDGELSQADYPTPDTASDLTVYVHRVTVNGEIGWQVRLIKPEEAERCPKTRAFVNKEAAQASLNDRHDAGAPFRCNRGHIHATRRETKR